MGSRPFNAGKIVTIECHSSRASNRIKEYYRIKVIIRSSVHIYGSWIYTVTPVSGSGEFSVSAKRIVGK